MSANIQDTESQSQFCIGIPGGPVPHKVLDPNDLILGRRSECEALLFSAKSWGSASPIADSKKHVPPPSKRFRNYPDRAKGLGGNQFYAAQRKAEG